MSRTPRPSKTVETAYANAVKIWRQLPREVGAISSLHLLAGLLAAGDSPAREFLLAHGVTLEAVAASRHHAYPVRGERFRAHAGGPEVWSSAAEAARAGAVDRARYRGNTSVGADDLLASLAVAQDADSGQVLAEMGVTADVVLSWWQDRAGLSTEERTSAEVVPTSGPKPDSLATQASPTDSPAGQLLPGISRNLTAMAQAGSLKPIVGRSQERAQAITTLRRDRKNNPVFVGPPGVGKTRLAEEMALYLYESGDPRQVAEVSPGALVAGTKYRGDFEERLMAILNWAMANNVVLFIDELDAILGLGRADGSPDAAAILKPLLVEDNRSLQLMGATDQRGWDHIQHDAALERRFRPITVEPPTPEEALAMVRLGHVERLEACHGVVYAADAVRAAVYLGAANLPGRTLPDLAIDALDEAGSRVLVASDGSLVIPPRDGETPRTITADDVAAVISEWSGRPAGTMTAERRTRALSAITSIRERIVGQDEAVASACLQLLSGYAQMTMGRGPLGKLVCIGPSGVGKTELALAIAEGIFGDRDALVHIDLSNYPESHMISGLIGAHAEYVGHGVTTAALTDPVRRRSHCVVLIDELPRALWFQDVLRGIFDGGFVIDGEGRRVDFTKTFVVVTGNWGAENLAWRPSAGFMSTRRVLPPETIDSAARAKARDQMLRAFRSGTDPAFQSQVGDPIVFYPLLMPELREIGNRRIDAVIARVAEAGAVLTVTEPARLEVCSQGYNPVEGARRMDDVVRRGIIDLVAPDMALRPAGSFDEIIVDRGPDGELSATVLMGGQVLAPLSVVESLRRQLRGTQDRGL